MKNKMIHICYFLALLIFFLIGVNVGRSAACVVDDTAQTVDLVTDVQWLIEDTQSIYQKAEAEAFCSGCFDCGGGNGERYVIVPKYTGSFVEIRGVGIFSILSGNSDKLQIYFNNCEDAKNFGCREVYVRGCENDL